jgi:hypothetical protein
MVVLISMIALTVDVGLLMTARTEAQRVADLSALAGAGILAIDPDADAEARTEAIKFAALNTICGETCEVSPGDVDVDLDAATVTVRVQRTEANGAPVRTYFARVFGVRSVDVATTATAIAEPAGAPKVICLLPLLLPDRWAESGLPPDDYVFGGLGDTFDPEIADPKPGELDNDGVWDTYVPPGQTGATGYDVGAIGTRIEIRVAGGGGGHLNPSWYFPWTPLDAADRALDGGPGGANYRARFTECMQAPYLRGDLVLTEPGAMTGPTEKGFQDLYDSDPSVFWNETEGCPWRPEANDGNGACDYSTPRIRPIPMFNPYDQPAAGRKTVTISNFGNLFVEGLQPGGSYSGIWLGLLTESDTTDAPGNGLPKHIRLIR